jgi:hypothetical protein
MKKGNKIKIGAILGVLLFSLVCTQAAVAFPKPGACPREIYGTTPPYKGMPSPGNQSPCSPGGWFVYRDTTTNTEWSVRVGWCEDNPCDNRYEIIYVHNNPTPYDPTITPPQGDTD